MKNNLTEKDIENLNKWAEKYGIVELKIKDKEKIFNLKGLYIGGRGNLTELPKEIGILTNLKMLIIRCNNLKELPKEIYNLINLEKLSIIINNLEISPDGIEKPINFKSLPIEEIGKLNNLKDLSIRIRKKEK